MYTINQVQSYSEELGQTILEIIVALALIMLFLSGIIVIELYAIRNVEYSRNKSLATKLARQQLDRARGVRDSAGISVLTNCTLTSCYINSQLTPVQVTPTGTFGQSLKIETSTDQDCPLPEITITPAPVSYKIISTVTWSGVAGVTPAPEVEVSSCLTDWW